MFARALGIVLLLVLLAAPATGVRAAPGPTASLRGAAVHAPIVIEGDAALTAANGVTGGTGTPGDPFVISGWALDASASAGLFLANTSASVLVQDVTVQGTAGFSAFPGVRLHNVTGVTVESTNVTGTAAGVLVDKSSAVAVSGDDLSGNRIGLEAADTTDLTVQGTTITSLGTLMLEGVDVVRANGTALLGNTVAIDTPGPGTNEIHIASSSGIVVDRNRIGSEAWIPSGGVGLWLDGDVDVSLAGNAFLARGVSPTPFAGSSFHAFALSLASFASLTIAADNTVNGRPIIYCLGQPGRTYDGTQAGEIILADCDDAYVSNVSLANGQIGLVVALSRSVEVVGDAFSNVTLAVTSWLADAVVYHNNFFRSGVAQIVSGTGASTVAFDAGYPRGGNYWSGGSGADACSGPLQDVCPDPDGFLDRPKELTPFVYDEYPLAAPADLANRWPVALLGTDTVVADLLTPIRFDAVASYDFTGNASDLRMRWDFDGDGRWDTDWAPLGTVTHYYGAPGFYRAALEVRDGGGLLSIGSRTVLVEYFTGWDILVPVLGGIAGALAANYVVGRYLAKRRRTRALRKWSKAGGPQEAPVPPGRAAGEPPQEPRGPGGPPRP